MSKFAVILGKGDCGPHLDQPTPAPRVPGLVLVTHNVVLGAVRREHAPSAAEEVSRVDELWCAGPPETTLNALRQAYAGMHVIQTSLVREHTIFERRGVMAGDYEDAEGDVSNALYLRVNQSGLARIGDIAVGLLDEQTLNDSLSALNPVYSDSYLWDTVTVNDDVESVTFDTPSFDFTPADGTLGLTVTIPNLYVDTLAYGSAVGFDFSSDVAVWASSAVLTADLGVTAKNGKLNVTNPFFPLPPIKGNVFLKYTHGSQHLTYEMHYTAPYHDQAVGSQYRNIDSFVTHDLHYNISFWDDRAEVSLSAVNLLDEDPPQTFTNLNYDPYTHNPFGRTFKLGLTYNFGVTAK